MLLSTTNIAIIVAVVVIVAVAVLYSAPLLLSGPRELMTYFTTSTWDPVHERYGILFAIGGSLVVALIAVVISGLLAVSSAVFIVEIAPPSLRTFLETLVDLAASIPSVIYGLWGLTVLAPFIRDYIMSPLTETLPVLSSLLGRYSPSGASILTAGVLLSVMVYPFATSIIREAIKMIPGSVREALYSLALTKWEILRYELSYIRPSILAGIMLAFGRAVGETVAVAMVVGNVVNPEFYKIFMPGYTISSLIANQFLNATGAMIPALFGAALILLVIGLLTNTLVMIYFRRTRR